MRYFPLLLGVLSWLSPCAGYEVLIYHDMGTRSHLLQLYPIVEKLLDNGHKVTGVYFNSAKIKHENYTEILIENFMEDKMKEISKMFMEKGGTSAVNLRLWKASWDAWSSVIEKFALLPWTHPDISNLLETEKKFDAVITLVLDSYLAELFNCSLITWSPSGPVPMFIAGTGNVINLREASTSKKKKISDILFILLMIKMIHFF